MLDGISEAINTTMFETHTSSHQMALLGLILIGKAGMMEEKQEFEKKNRSRLRRIRRWGKNKLTKNKSD